VEANSVFNGTPQGFNEGQKTSLLDILSSGQRGVSNTRWKMMGKQLMEIGLIARTDGVL
jgi:hypothetical protein